MEISKATVPGLDRADVGDFAGLLTPFNVTQPHAHGRSRQILDRLGFTRSLLVTPASSPTRG